MNNVWMCGWGTLESTEVLPARVEKAVKLGYAFLTALLPRVDGTLLPGALGETYTIANVLRHARMSRHHYFLLARRLGSQQG